MIGKIKSIYFSRMIFSSLREKLKLDLIKYNKNLQKEFNISLLNYKIFSGKYIIFEDNEYGKEYDAYNDNLIFEGEYLNGKRNGKGKEYKYGKLIFKGDYLNGKKYGKGKEYDDYGSIKSEGEYLYGKLWNWKRKSYNTKNGIIYKIKNGNGIVKEYGYIGNLLFECQFLNGEITGRGKEYSYGKLKFEGEYLNGKKWNGKGYNKKNEIIFELKNGKGFVKEYDNGANYLKFEGEYLNGERNGKGKEYNRDGKLIFEGEYLYNHKIKGKEYINGILEYEGEYLYDIKWNGKGYDRNHNVIYEINNGNGKMKEYNLDGKLIFKGEYLNGKRNGKGKEYDLDGNITFKGEYLNGKRNGKGKEYDEKGNIIFEGEYLNGEPLD